MERNFGLAENAEIRTDALSEERRKANGFLISLATAFVARLSVRVNLDTQLETSNYHGATTVFFASAYTAGAGVGRKTQCALDGFARSAPNLCD
jgi:hypothetical protein